MITNNLTTALSFSFLLIIFTSPKYTLINFSYLDNTLFKISAIVTTAHCNTST